MFYLLFCYNVTYLDLFKLQSLQNLLIKVKITFGGIRQILSKQGLS